MKKNSRNERCYGSIQIPETLIANPNVTEDSVEYFSDGINIIIRLISKLTGVFDSFSSLQYTRGGLAAYDAGIAKIKSSSIFYMKAGKTHIFRYD